MQPAHRGRGPRRNLRRAARVSGENLWSPALKPCDGRSESMLCARLVMKRVITMFMAAKGCSLRLQAGRS